MNKLLTHMLNQAHTSVMLEIAADAPRPCMNYGTPCHAGTPGNCVCRKRFFESAAKVHGALSESQEKQFDGEGKP